ncbi:scavenger receptor cysteine-rich type 1 protein M130-like [Sphaeramia orbicularis]|uniref:scavenger receptor cysteine-rich type 1 protein M130-like n=1 Tax=Sphaeramia orbicularis TaxID=375764 RepID=UPI00117C81BB|nr:scavenger receptor cysteine-rich type 1 protein M130-like [Sphaeramia orbicularis]
MFLTCSDSVRLVHGSSLCSGRLEVRSDRSWSSVCEEDLDLNDAQVVCRELGCGAPGLLQGGLYGEGEAPVWTSELQCEGNESVVLDCRRSSSAGKTCSPGTAAGLTVQVPSGRGFHTADFYRYQGGVSSSTVCGGQVGGTAEPLCWYCGDPTPGTVETSRRLL